MVDVGIDPGFRRLSLDGYRDTGEIFVGDLYFDFTICIVTSGSPQEKDDLPGLVVMT